MGSGISTEEVKAHLENQDRLIKQLQSVVEWQGSAIDRLMTYTDNAKGDNVAVDAGEDAIKDENHRQSNRREEKPISEEESKAPDAVQGSEEEERNFMATKPWLGAMAKPTGFQFGQTDGLPDVKLELEHIHGYRTRGVRQNVAMKDANTIVYFAAAVGIVHTLSTNTQKFFRDHTDDILCLTYHAGKKLVATGEIGKRPKICVWNVDTQVAVAQFAPIHQRGIQSLAFSADGAKIASVGIDDDHTVAVHDVATGALLSACKGDSQKIIDIEANMTKGADSNNQWVTVGVRHIKFWKLSATGGLSGEKGIIGKKGELKSFLSIAFTTTLACIGTNDGEIYTFKGKDMFKALDAHQKHIFSMRAVGDTLFTGGKDGFLSQWNMNSFTKVASINMNNFEDPEVLSAGANSVRAIYYLDEQTILLGTQTSTIYSVDITSKSARSLVVAHYGKLGEQSDDNYGELWGLKAHPSEDLYATAGEDKTLRVWDIKTRKQKSRFNLKAEAISVAWARDGKQIAVGLSDGGVQIISWEKGSLKEVSSFKKRNRRIQCLAFSPNGKVLAVGSADNLIDLYAVGETYRLMNTCKGNSSVILHVDFSADGKYLQSCAQSYELLFYETDSGNQFVKSHDLKDTKWATFTSILGWDVQGIWPAESDGSDINAVGRSCNSKYLATAEDTGLVKIFNYPCVGGGLNHMGSLTRRPQSTAASGHSSHVTNVDWKSDDTYLFTTGGADLSVFQWKVVKA